MPGLTDAKRCADSGGASSGNGCGGNLQAGEKNTRPSQPLGPPQLCMAAPALPVPTLALAGRPGLGLGHGLAWALVSPGLPLGPDVYGPTYLLVCPCLPLPNCVTRFHTPSHTPLTHNPPPLPQSIGLHGSFKPTRHLTRQESMAVAQRCKM
jgi:hypothetical protein